MASDLIKKKMTPCLIININISLKARDNILILIQATILKKECKN